MSLGTTVVLPERETWAWRLRCTARRHLPRLIAFRIPKHARFCRTHRWYVATEEHNECYDCVATCERWPRVPAEARPAREHDSVVIRGVVVYEGDEAAHVEVVGELGKTLVMLDVPWTAVERDKRP